MCCVKFISIMEFPVWSNAWKRKATHLQRINVWGTASFNTKQHSTSFLTFNCLLQSVIKPHVHSHGHSKTVTTILLTKVVCIDWEVGKDGGVGVWGEEEIGSVLLSVEEQNVQNPVKGCFMLWLALLHTSIHLRWVVAFPLLYLY